MPVHITIVEDDEDIVVEAPSFVGTLNSLRSVRANLIGVPALVSGGVQLMGKAFSESVLLSLAGSVERAGE